MITSKGLNRINVLDCTEGSNLLDVNCTNIGVKVNQDYLSTLYGFWLGDGSTCQGRITENIEDEEIFISFGTSIFCICRSFKIITKIIC